MYKLTINEFIQLTKKNPSEWKNYCEILLTGGGRVILARPSHQEAAIEYMYNIDDDITKQEFINNFPKECSPLHWVIDKYDLIAIWYNGFIYGSKINRFQKRSIEILQNNNLIKKDLDFIEQTKEYRNYLYRQEIYNS